MTKSLLFTFQHVFVDKSKRERKIPEKRSSVRENFFFEKPKASGQLNFTNFEKQVNNLLEL